jgi:hypothetical protein
MEVASEFLNLKDVANFALQLGDEYILKRRKKI